MHSYSNVQLCTHTEVVLKFTGHVHLSLHTSVHKPWPLQSLGQPPSWAPVTAFQVTVGHHSMSGMSGIAGADVGKGVGGSVSPTVGSRVGRTVETFVGGRDGSTVVSVRMYSLGVVGMKVGVTEL